MAVYWSLELRFHDTFRTSNALDLRRKKNWRSSALQVASDITVKRPRIGKTSAVREGGREKYKMTITSSKVLDRTEKRGSNCCATAAAAKGWTIKENRIRIGERM